MQLPSTEELDALFSDRRLNTIAFFLDETFEELAYDVTMTVLEAVEQLAGIIKLQVCGCVGVWEVWAVVQAPVQLACPCKANSPIHHSAGCSTTASQLVSSLLKLWPYPPCHNLLYAELHHVHAV